VYGTTAAFNGYYRFTAGTGFLNGGYGGVENTSTTGPIYCIGDSYVPTSTTTGTMYGIGYSYNTFTGAYGPASTWGMYVVGGGTVGVFLDAGGAGYFRTTITAQGNITGAYILGTYFNASAGNSENPTIGQIWTQNTTDNYLRKSTPAHFRSQITDGYYVTGSGTAGYIPKFTGTGFSIGNSGMYDDGTTISLITRILSTDQKIISTFNTATGIANNSFNTAKTILGNIHIANGSGTSGNNYQGAITFQGGTASEAQAGIYVSNNGSTGTAMGFATTGSYATGPQLFMTATNDGVVNFPRAVPTYAGTSLVYNSGTWGINITGNAATATLAANTSSISSAVGGAYNWTGIQYFVSNRNTTSDSPPLQAYSSNGSGAIMAFHRGGYYAVNMGLDSDNVFRIGGWSASPNRLQLDMSGNLTVSGALAGTNFSGSSSGTNTGDQTNISGQAGYLGAAGYIYRGVFSGNWNADFQNTPAGTYRYYGDNAGDANSPGGSWWFSESYRHSNASNYWGTQVAWGWEDNANRLATRNITGNSFGGWVYYLNSSNFTSYIDAPNKAGTSYYQVNTWMQVNGAYGLYFPNNYGGHFSPNDLSSYTQFAIRGSKSGYGGIYDQYSAVHGIMYDAAGNGGVYREASGKWYWYYLLANDCFAVGGSTTSASYRLYVNGPAYTSGVMYADGGLNSGSADIQWGGSERQVGRYRYLWYGYWAMWYDLNGGNGGGSLVYADTLYATYGSVSDIRYKKEVTASTYGLSDVLKMNTIRYKYDLPIEKRSGDDPNFHIGFSAQEMLEIVPEAVMYDKTREVYAIATNEIIPILVNSIKELKAEINELKLILNK
jgi:hypothetical protein